MPELKRNFLKGKMNKDLDERLVPNGEYRDASNIEISTSEGSNVGSAQTLRGNKSVSDLTIASSAVTVGTYVDEQNEYIYNFIHKASDLTNGVGTKSDAIVRYKKDALLESVDSEIVFVDAYETILVPTTAGGTYSGGQIGVRPSSGNTTASTNQIYGIEKELVAFLAEEGAPNNATYYQAKGIKPGMRVQAIDANGVDLWGDNDVRVVSATVQTNIHAVLITPVVGYAIGYGTEDTYQEYYGAQMIADGVKLRFTSDRLLKFNEGTLETESNNKKADGTDAYSSAQYTPNNNIITSINTIGGLLYWTDGRNEPKKINIDNCIFGSKWSNSATPLIYSSRFYLPQTDTLLDYIKESNITVIKPAPTKPPTIKVNNSRQGISNALLKRLTGSSTISGTFVFYHYPSGGAGVFQPGYSNFRFGSSLPGINWQVGDLLNLVGQTSGKTATIRLINEDANNAGYFVAELVAIDPTYVDGAAAEEWFASLDIEEKLIYKDTFLTFGYRYKYSDGETSVISPYTKPIFNPSKYEYDPKEGFNLGMENKIESIEICDFIPNDIPQDVVEVELVYRDTNSLDKATSIDKIKIDDTQATTLGSGSNKGYFKINAEVFGALLPSDQVDRNEDHVPTSAVAQEITASRLMYGNYTEGYDLVKSDNKKIKHTLEASLTKVPQNISVVEEYSENTFVAYVSSTQSNVADAATPIYNEVFPLDTEQSDEGDNFNTTTYKYTVPEAGTYNFDLSGKWWGKNAVQIGGTVGSPSGSFYSYFVPARLILKKTPSGGGATVTVTTANSGSNAIISSEFSNGGYNISSTSAAATDWEYADLYSQYKNIDLVQGDVIHLEIEALAPTTANLPTIQYYQFGDYWTPEIADATSWENTTSHQAFAKGQILICNSAPSSVMNTIATAGKESIKTLRTYNIGVVYRDAYNRQSTVLVDDTVNLNVPKQEVGNINKFLLKITNQAPAWAEYYKFFIKENTNNYYNLVASSFYDNNDAADDAQHAWISFNSVDIDKIQKEEYLILKKKHNSQVVVSSPLAKWKVLDISRTEPIAADGETSLITNSSEIVGKFFVKIAKDSNFDTYIGTAFNLLGPTKFGAVFETEPKKVEQDEKTGLYWEASQAYPIKLNEKNAETHIKVGSRVEYYRSYGLTSDEIEAIKSQFNNESVLVNRVLGAKTFSKSLLNTENTIANNRDAYCIPRFNKIVTNIIIPDGGNIEFKFTDLSDGSFVTARLGKSSYNSNELFLIPYTCPVADYTSNYTHVALPWYNCINFLNGVESDTIKDDFNADSIFEYLSGGKASGLKTSIFYEDYKKERKENDVIFSQVFNEKTNYNRFNEFLIGKNIVKQLSPENGSIQRLFSRDTDLLAFCENKVLKILADKDALFDAGGNALQIATGNVLGQTIPFAGDYGISKNPESLAVDEYRIYFTDKARGSVLRLSLDGITVISDYGMKDWFFDNMLYAQAMIGSFDGKKDEYNIAIHSVTNPQNKKDVYTISFAEDVNGWSSFKSFIKESGVTLNNFYYTFKNGKPYLHHVESVDRNNFYGIQFDSSVQPIFNDFTSSVKTFSTVNYEGTQSKVDQNTDARDLGYYNLNDVNGWYIKNLFTDLQEAEVFEFIEKEGKWFNKIVGKATTFTNAGNTGNASGNLDTREFSVQGIGVTSADMTVISGSVDGYNFDVDVSITENATWTSTSVDIDDVTGLSGTSTFTITPNSGYILSASSFTAPATSYYSSITFADDGTAGSATNTVTATINWITQSISSDLSLTIDLSSISALSLTTVYESVLDVFHNKSAGDNVNYLVGRAGDYGDFTHFPTGSTSSWDSSTQTLTLNGGENGGFNYAGIKDLWPADSENDNIFTFTYTIDASSTVNPGELTIESWGNCINASDITLNTTTGTHSVDITIEDKGTTDRFYINNSSTSTARDAKITNMSLKRKVDTKETVLFTNVNSNITISSDQIPDNTEKSRYLITGSLQRLINHNLFTVKLKAQGTGYYSTIPELSFNPTASVDHSIASEINGFNTAGFVNSNQVAINYYAEDDLLYENNAGISFGSQSVTEETYVAFDLENFVASFNAGTYQLNFNGNGNSPTFEVTSGSSWLSVESNANFDYFQNQYNLSGLQGYVGTGQVDITLQAQPGGGAQRSGVIAITNSYNTTGTPDDTITIIQQADGSTEFISIFAEDNSGTYQVITGQSPDFNIVSDAVLGDIIPLSFYVSTSSSTLTTGDISVNVTSGDAGWLVITDVQSSETVGDFLVSGYAKATDSSLYFRSAAVRATYPGSSLFSEQRVDQIISNPTVNTITAVNSLGSGPSTGWWVDTSNVIKDILITSSQTGSPTPTFEIVESHAYYGPDSANTTNYTDQVEPNFEYSQVEVITGAAHTHRIQVTTQSYPDGVGQGIIPPENIVLLQQKIRIYHQQDYAFTNPAEFTITQAVHSSTLNPS